MNAVKHRSGLAAGPVRLAGITGPTGPTGAEDITRSGVIRLGAVLLALAPSVLTFTGCATVNSEQGFAPVQALAQDKLGKQLHWARTDADRLQLDQRVAELLAQPLDADAAVQLALLNNRGLQAAFEQIGIGDAERVQASRLPNPGFSFGRLRRGDEVEIERGLHISLARLLALPLLKQAEQSRFEQTQADVAGQVVALAAQARKAWIDAVAAEQMLGYAQQVQQAADASVELARRMAQAGNFNKLQQLREQSFSADAAQNLARAQRARLATREKLARLLGLPAKESTPDRQGAPGKPGTQGMEMMQGMQAMQGAPGRQGAQGMPIMQGMQAGFSLPERLPDLPTEALQLPDAERTAMAQRLDVLAAKRRVEQTASSLGLTRTTRVINVLELGAVRNSSNELPTQRGYEISLELPLFDWGGARVERAEAIYRQALHRAADTAIQARSEVREAYGGYRSAWDIARHQRDEVLPLRQRIAQENLLRYNGMLIGVFELLADARAQIAAVSTAIDSLREFWLAQAELELALLGKPDRMPAQGAAIGASTGTAAEAPGAGH